MIKNNCNCANSHMLFTDLMTKKNSEDLTGYAFADKPYAVIKYISTCARFQIRVLDTQLSQIDSLTEPEKYDVLSLLLDEVFALLDLCTESMKVYNSIDCQFFKEKKA